MVMRQDDIFSAFGRMCFEDSKWQMLKVSRSFALLPLWLWTAAISQFHHEHSSGKTLYVHELCLSLEMCQWDILSTW